MVTINGTDFNGNNTVNGNGKFRKFLVKAIALLLLILIEFSLGTVITAPAVALTIPEGCIVIDGGIVDCPAGGGDDGNEGFNPPLEPDPKPSNQPKPPNQPKPKPPNQSKPPNPPKPDPFVCNKKPDLPQCN